MNLRRRKNAPHRATVAERVAAEIERQNDEWGPFDPGRPSIRLGIACLEDEVAEVLEAERDDRADDFCGLGFAHTKEELIQVAAIAQRLVEAFEGGGPRRRQWLADQEAGNG